MAGKTIFDHRDRDFVKNSFRFSGRSDPYPPSPAVHMRRRESPEPGVPLLQATSYPSMGTSHLSAFTQICVQALQDRIHHSVPRVPGFQKSSNLSIPALPGLLRSLKLCILGVPGNTSFDYMPPLVQPQTPGIAQNAAPARPQKHGKLKNAHLGQPQTLSTTCMLFCLRPAPTGKRMPPREEGFISSALAIHPFSYKEQSYGKSSCRYT